MRGRPLSLSALLPLLVIGSLVLLGSLMLLLVAVEVRSAQEQLQQQTLEGEAREIQSEIEAFLENHLQLLEDHSRLPVLVQGVMQPETSRAQLRDLMAQLSFLGLRYPLTLLDYQGRTLQSAAVPPRFPYQKAPWIEALLSGQAPHYTGLSELEGRYYWRLAVPVRYGGLAEGILVVEIPLAQLVRQLHLEAHLEQAQLAIYQDGQPLLSTWRSLTAPLRFVLSWPEMGLELRVQLDTAEAQAERDRLLLKMLLLGLLITLLVALFATWLGWHYLSRPLGQLLKAVTELEQGARLPATIRHNPIDEIERLAARFNRMATQVEQRESDLEERNQTLATLNRELKSSQAQLVQSEKMSSLGTLAAGIAHEVNNPLGYIKSNLQTLEQYQQVLLGWAARCAAEPELVERCPALAAELVRLKAESDLDYILEDSPELLAETLEGADRVQKIVQDLKSFARIDSGELGLVNINEGIASCLRILANELKYHCQVHESLSEIPRVWGSSGRLNQVFMNLILNAAQAVGAGGEIWISSFSRDGQVAIEVCDNGPGVNDALKAEIFTPFFTTKPVGQGTGLGLSISHGIVEKHGGRIELERARAGGACFRVWLPAWRQPLTRSGQADG